MSESQASQPSEQHVPAESPRLRRLCDDREHTLKEVSVIGRSSDCDVCIDDEDGVSRKHARITVDGPRVSLLDLGSLNGTLLNGRPVDGKHDLSHGDVLVFDDQEYEILIPGQADTPSAAGGRPAMRLVDDTFLDAEFLDSEPAPSAAPAATPRDDEQSRGRQLPTLIVLLSDDVRIRLPLSPRQASWTIGSAVDADLSIQHQGVEERHASLHREGGEWILADLGSERGSAINGRAIRTARLNSGDRVRIGAVDCLFVVPDSAGMADEPPASKPARPAPVPREPAPHHDWEALPRTGTALERRPLRPARSRSLPRRLLRGTLGRLIPGVPSMRTCLLLMMALTAGLIGVAAWFLL